MEDIQPIEVNDVFKEKARNMINKLLDLPQPRLDERMVDFLSTTGRIHHSFREFGIKSNNSKKNLN